MDDLSKIKEEKLWIEDAEKVVIDLRENQKEFYGVVLCLLHKYKDPAFDRDMVSPNYKLLFRIITDKDNDRIRSDDKNKRLFQVMQEDVDIIKRRFGYTFDTFSNQVKSLVTFDEGGYTKFARLMYGQTIWHILKIEPNEQKQTSIKIQRLLNAILDSYNSWERGQADECIINLVKEMEKSNESIANLVTKLNGYNNFMIT